MKYSPSNKIFYPPDINYAPEDLPPDLVDATMEDYAMVQARDISEGFDYVDGAFVIVPPPQPTFDEYKKAGMVKIDHVAEVARVAAVGDVMRAVEYDITAQEAKEYKEAGYPAEIPPSVKTWAEIKGWTGQQAADNILETRARYIECLLQVRDIRLRAKDAVAVAVDSDAVDVAVTASTTQLRQIAEYVASL